MRVCAVALLLAIALPLGVNANGAAAGNCSAGRGNCHDMLRVRDW